MPFTRDSMTVTVLGGGGFVGRYVCEALLKAGVRLRVAQRDPRRAYFLQPLGQVGQVGLVRADMRKPETIDRAVEGSAAVINLVGAFSGDLRAIHGTGAGRAAKAARATGAGAFVQVSAIGADADSPSYYGQTKAEGEAAVRSAFPSATIIRPSVLFGPEDDFTNRFARLAQFPILPIVAPRTRLQPLHVRDLGNAVAMAALEPKRFGGKTFELGGPEAMTMRQLVERIAALAGQSPSIVELPDFAAAAIAAFGFLPGAPLTRDQWLMLQKDNVPAARAKGIDPFGIAPTALSAAGEWLSRFRKGGRFAPRAALSEPGA